MRLIAQEERGTGRCRQARIFPVGIDAFILMFFCWEGNA